MPVRYFRPPAYLRDTEDGVSLSLHDILMLVTVTLQDTRG